MHSMVFLRRHAMLLGTLSHMQIAPMPQLQGIPGRNTIHRRLSVRLFVLSYAASLLAPPHFTFMYPVCISQGCLLMRWCTCRAQLTGRPTSPTVPLPLTPPTPRQGMPPPLHLPAPMVPPSTPAMLPRPSMATHLRLLTPPAAMHSRHTTPTRPMQVCRTSTAFDHMF